MNGERAKRDSFVIINTLYHNIFSSCMPYDNICSTTGWSEWVYIRAVYTSIYYSVLLYINMYFLLFLYIHLYRIRRSAAAAEPSRSSKNIVI